MASEDKPAVEPVNLPQYFDLDGTSDMDSPINPEIVGTIPSWISGSLYRNGSGVYKMGTDQWKHIVDGFAVLHRWSIDEGKVTFLQSVLDSDHYKKCCKSNCLIGNGFASNFSDPNKSGLKKALGRLVPAPPEKSDNTQVNIVEIGGRLFALTDTPLLNEIDPETLKIKSKYELDKKVSIHVGTAHPLTQRDGSCVYYFGTNMMSASYNFITIPINNDQKDPFSGAEIVAKVSSKSKTDISFTHSFGVTDNYFVHLEQPYTFNLPKVMTMGMRNLTMADCMKIHADTPISILIVSKETGKKVPITYLAPHGFVFHFVNCYEENEQIVCDVCYFDTPDVLSTAYIDELINQENKTSGMAHAKYARYVLPLKVDEAACGENLVTLPGSSASAVLRSGKDKEKTLNVIPDTPFDDSYYFDVPTINNSCTGIKHQYVYASSSLILPQRRLMKFDTVKRCVVEWQCESTHVPGEPVFVPRPGATEEDDGVVLCTVLAETTNNSSYLVILDAASFKEIARASVPSDTKMAFTNHGFFSQNKKQ